MKRTQREDSVSREPKTKAKKLQNGQDVHDSEEEKDLKTYVLNDGNDPKIPARVYCDGIFDMFHYGHARALMQAKKLLPNVHLIVGVCNDELTQRYKGKTVMTHAERAESLRHCRYVDEVVENAPWVVDQAFLDLHKIDYVAHGDDIIIGPDGNDCYKFVKDQGRFLVFGRTEGVSTSELILRIIKDYEAYVRRNLSRGYTHKDLGISLLKEKRIVYGDKLRKVAENIENKSVAAIKGFLKRFGVQSEHIHLTDEDLMATSPATSPPMSPRSASEDDA
eukprot:TRINITY_DN4831_c0_g1_i1.p1 TRINITY_DN4831_c0_g1~~TRINITY_DN4831_c0_g1_i1.p1  ORF type:complete len:278 (+),score=103.14 TRINITY_DN4831_c0_g1_i1:142-975(+)